MAKLSVNNKILRYKQTSYQILNISSLKPIVYQKPIKINYISLDNLKPLSIFSGILIFVGILCATSIFLISILCFTVAGFILKYCFDRYNKRKEQDLLSTTMNMYGLSVRTNNGDNPKFMSSNKDVIDKIHDAILEAINGSESVNISFDNANIEIIESENVTIGAV